MDLKLVSIVREGDGMVPSQILADFQPTRELRVESLHYVNGPHLVACPPLL
jgi:hypothetical protein